MQEGLAQRLKQEAENISLVDTHEHIILEQERLEGSLDLFYLFPHYASSDLVSSGMAPEILEEIRGVSEDIEARWRKFKPYWEKIKNTNFCKTLLIAVRDLFDIDGITDSTYQELSHKIADSNKPGWYRKVLKDKANIEVCILDYLPLEVRENRAPRIEQMVDVAVSMGAYLTQRKRKVPHLDPEFFLPVAKFDGIVSIRTLGELRALEVAYNKHIHCLSDLLSILDEAFEEEVDRGVVGVKTTLAYGRTLKYDKVSNHEAELLFNRIFSHLGEGLSWRETKPLQDFLMHQVIRRAIDYDLPIQIHTGFQEGAGNIITNSRPSDLLNLFVEYNRAVFILFHAGYPYVGEVTTIAKNFPNVYADLCFLAVLSPSLYKKTLEVWLEMLPGSKILGFGGDYIIVEGAYAQARIVRECVSEVMAKKVEEKYFTEEEVVDLMKQILNRNAKHLFHLDRKDN